MTDHAKIGKKI